MSEPAKPEGFDRLLKNALELAGAIISPPLYVAFKIWKWSKGKTPKPDEPPKT